MKNLNQRIIALAAAGIASVSSFALPPTPASASGTTPRGVSARQPLGSKGAGGTRVVVPEGSKAGGTNARGTLPDRRKAVPFICYGIPAPWCKKYNN